MNEQTTGVRFHVTSAVIALAITLAALTIGFALRGGYGPETRQFRRVHVENVAPQPIAPGAGLHVGGTALNGQGGN